MSLCPVATSPLLIPLLPGRRSGLRTTPRVSCSFLRPSGHAGATFRFGEVIGPTEALEPTGHVPRAPVQSLRALHGGIRHRTAVDKAGL